MTQTTDQLAGDVPPPKRRKVDDDRPSSPLDHLPPPQNGQPDPPPPPPHDPPPQDNPRQEDPVKDGHAGDDPDKDNPAMEDPAMDDPAMEDPAKDDPAMEDPVMEDPTKKDPAKHDPAKHDPAKHGPAMDDPAMDDHAKDDPAKDGPAKDVAPTDDPPKGDVPTDGFLADGVPKDGVPTDGVSTDGVSREGVLTDGVPKDGVPTDGVFKDGVPTDGVPIDDVSKNGVPMDDVSQDGVPKNGAPVDDVPRDNPPPIDPSQNDLPQSDPPQEAQPPPPPQEAPLPPHDTSPPPPPPAERAPHDLDPLDDMRPPRRQDIHGDEPHDPVALPVPMDTLQMPPTGLTPEVDAVLSKIFASGLFERKDVDGRALDFLASVSPQLALAALEDIQRRDFSTVRNKPAFIMSIFKRVVNAGGSLQPSVTGTAFQPTSVPASALAHLPPSVSDALQRVFQSGVCHPSQFDDRAMDILVDLAEPDAVRALSEFAAMEPGRVRNPSAFWMGLARKYKGHSRAPGGRAGPSYDGTTATAYGAYDAYDARRPAVSSAMLEQRLDELAASGHLPRNALDDRAMDALRRLPEQDALGVLAELPEPARVRNMSAYVMGLCKKFAAGEARSLSQRGSYNTGGYGGYGGYSAYGASGYGGYGGYGHTGAHAGYATGYGAPGGYGSQYGAAVPGAYGTHPIDDNTRARETREALETMDPSVRDRFYQMTDQGIITESSFDARAISAMQNLRAEDACAALDELAASEPGRIHNISAYFMGLAKKFGRSSM